MALQHLRSSTADKRPTPGAMSDGQLAVNTNAASTGLFFKDSAGALVKVGPVHVGTTAPNASPAVGGQSGNTVGEQWLDTTGGTYVFKVWDGSAWRSETGTFVDVNGDVMTGALGIIAGTDSAPGLYFSGDTNTGLYSPGADQLALSTNGTGRLFIDASGNVGVGVASPANALSITGYGNATSGWSVGAEDGNTSGYFITTGNTSNSVLLAADPNNTGANSTLAFSVDGSEKARIDSSGRLLVGTSSSSSLSKFVIQGGAGTSACRMTLAFNNAIPNSGDTLGAYDIADSGQVTSARIEGQRDGGTWTSGVSQPTRLVFSTTADGASSPTERMRITNAGYLKVSDNGTYDNATNTRHEISQSGTDVALIIRSTITTVYQESMLFVVGNYNSTNGTWNFMRCRHNGVDRLFIKDNGNVQNANNSYTAISDSKLKENIVDANSQWDDIKHFRVRKYNFKAETGHSTHAQIGLVAQEVELVSPGLVSESPDRDEDGNDLGTVTKSVNYSVLYMKAVKALQEAMERIETLEAKVAALETL